MNDWRSIGKGKNGREKALWLSRGVESSASIAQGSYRLGGRRRVGCDVSESAIECEEPSFRLTLMAEGLCTGCLVCLPD